MNDRSYGDNVPNSVRQFAEPYASLILHSSLCCQAKLTVNKVHSIPASTKIYEGGYSQRIHYWYTDKFGVFLSFVCLYCGVMMNGCISVGCKAGNRLQSHSHSGGLGGGINSTHGPLSSVMLGQ